MSRSSASRSRKSSSVRLGFYRGEHYDDTLGRMNASRTTAFAAIYDKAADAKNKIKSQMCRFIQRGRTCPFGDKCTYAHTKEELVLPKCAFGDTCRTKNSKTNPCKYAHPKPFVPVPAEKVDAADTLKAGFEKRKAAMDAPAAAPTAESFIITFGDDDKENEDNEDNEEEMATPTSSPSSSPSSSPTNDEDEAIQRFCEEQAHRIPVTFERAPQPFQGWDCPALGPVPADAQYLENPFGASRGAIFEMEETDAARVIQEQQSYIAHLEQQLAALNTPSIPMMLSPAQLAQLSQQLGFY
jgi:hypothetical protein